MAPGWDGLLAILLVISTAAAMEAVAAWTHKHIMHGFGWRWHRSHHERGGEAHERRGEAHARRVEHGRRGEANGRRVATRSHRRFELNDLYAVAFAALAVLLFALGTRWTPLTYIAIGITLYGLLYFVLHDVLVHRRLPGVRWTPRGGYLKRLVQAHRLHHAVREREGCVSFGFIWAPPVERLTARLRAQRAAQGAEQRTAPKGTQSETKTEPQSETKTEPQTEPQREEPQSETQKGAQRDAQDARHEGGAARRGSNGVLVRPRPQPVSRRMIR